MVVKKKPSKKLPPKASIIRSGATPIKDLITYRKNPRIGDIDSIADSLDRNGQYRSIVVNIGTNASKQNEVLAGNHTFLAARKLGWDTILADFVDVDDDRARAIVLADNKTAENGTYDEKIIGELLAEVPDVLSTGFKPEEAQSLIEAAGASAQEVLDRLSDEGAFDVDLGDESVGEDSAVGGTTIFGETAVQLEDDDDFDPENDDPDDFIPESGTESLTTEEITNKSSEIKGVSELAIDLPEGPDFYKGFWQMPSIRTDMLMTLDEWPDPIETWAGSASRDLAAENPDQWFHYPWGGDSTKGLLHTDQVILSFYSWDEAFLNWFWTPNKYAAKVINSGIKYAITPDFSMWDGQSRFLNFWAQYRNLYVARYLQEVGVKVVPHIGMPMGDLDFVKKYIFGYWPKSIPLIANELQNFDPKIVKVHGDKIANQFLEMFKHFKPEGFVLYSGKKGREWFIENVQPKIKGVRVIHLDARSEILGRWRAEQNGPRRKKNTI